MPGYVWPARWATGAERRKKVEFDNRQTVEVKMAGEYMSFSAHADAKGIMQLITYCQPKNVLLVHGDAEKMVFLKSKIEQELSLACYKPANGETCTIVTQPTIAADVSLPLLKRDLQPTAELGDLTVKRRRLLHGVLVVKGSKVRVLESEAACTELGITRHEVRFTSTVTLQDPGAVSKTIDKLHTHLQRRLGITQHLGDGPISIGSVLLQGDEALGSYILSSIKNIDR
ncbi:integrator complex subunit 11-like [Pollicipes pollicipes]|uniref:integrator complex subunit 11-like n=1 Tax=Pollicipes pollicipes TaxID=41117 RepID=UPI001884F1BA|nr:integrator complex subunit 11-like [Pollicipes pollicipes]